MSATEPAETSPHAEHLAEAVRAGFPTAVAELAKLVRIPSVSWDGYDADQLVHSAEAVAELARETGVFDLVEVLSATPPEGHEHGHPAVVATRTARKGRPTVLLYAHHDVQPPGADTDWISAPYEPTVRGDRLYGRGAADDTAGILAHIAAIRALAEVLEGQGEDLDLGIIVFIEGEEEFGSRSLGSLFDQLGERLASDVIVVADSANWNLQTPALTVGLRGAVAFNLRVSTLDHASHSGLFGGQVPDAMLAAIQLLSSLWNADGSVAVEGLASAPGTTPAGYDEHALRADAGLLDGVTPIGRGEILARAWFQPAITITGIDAPTVRDASNTLLPSVRVRVSARVAPGQSAADYFDHLEAHLRSHAPHGAHLEIDDVDLGEPFEVNAEGWATAESLAALREGYGVEPVQIGMGGSIPFIADLAHRFPTTQILITGVEDPDSRAHSPNESVHLPTFAKAIHAEALFLARLNSRA
ncbi:MAG TPA: dipeptidase [Pseudolysinimonas sp.]|nr:dipeptidase [Pseudolysinimonas sp.]